MLLPSVTPVRKLLSNSPHVITKWHIACLPILSLPQPYTSVGVSSATYTWSLYCVDGKSIWQLQEEGTPVPAVVSKKAKNALECLHGLDIVFADLQDPNILYVASKGEGEGCVMLVDFDWPAKDGEGRYPAMLNLNNAWPDEVTPYGIMRKSHDLWQLARLKAICNPGA